VMLVDPDGRAPGPNPLYHMTAALGTYFQAGANIIDRFYTSSSVSIKTRFNDIFSGGTQTVSNTTETKTSTNLATLFSPTTSNEIKFEPTKTTVTNTTTSDIAYTINTGTVTISGSKSTTLSGENAGAVKSDVSIGKGFLSLFFSSEKNKNKTENNIGIRAENETSVGNNTSVVVTQEIGFKLD
jgi:hypothetical protein